MRVVATVFPGDVWYYPRSAKFACKGMNVVKSVNVNKGTVYFEDGGWGKIKDMVGPSKDRFGRVDTEDGQWVLLKRTMMPDAQLASLDKRRKIQDAATAVSTKDLEKMETKLESMLASLRKILNKDDE